MLLYNHGSKSIVKFSLLPEYVIFATVLFFMCFSSCVQYFIQMSENVFLIFYYELALDWLGLLRRDTILLIYSKTFIKSCTTFGKLLEPCRPQGRPGQ